MVIFYFGNPVQPGLAPFEPGMMRFFAVWAFRCGWYLCLKLVKAQLGSMVFAADGADLRTGASAFVMSKLLAAIAAERFRCVGFCGE